MLMLLEKVGAESSFDEDIAHLQCPENCCDVCQQELGTLIDQLHSQLREHCAAS